MPNERCVRRITTSIVAALVILCALGQMFNWQVVGVGAIVRSVLSLVGIMGAILLLCRRRITWIFLLPWALLQTWVIITDLSGPWFFQSLEFGWKRISSTRSNHVLISYEGSGVNFVGLIWLAIFIAMLAFRVLPRRTSPNNTQER